MSVLSQKLCLAMYLIDNIIQNDRDFGFSFETVQLLIEKEANNS